MLSDFDSLVQKRRELKEWWSLKSTIAAYNKQYHKLRVDVHKPSMIAFCGQQYAGAKNYHDAPDFFFAAVLKEMAEQANEITAKAYEKELARLDAEIEKHRAMVLEQLSAE